MCGEEAARRSKEEFSISLAPGSQLIYLSIGRSKVSVTTIRVAHNYKAKLSCYASQAFMPNT